jgi:hypothetical protein
VIDHLVYAVPDLTEACDRIEREWGVRPSAGGEHVGRGTHNALLDLGEEAYLEIIAPDPKQPEPARPRPFGIEGLASARLVTWAAKAPDIDERVARSRAADHDPGAIQAMSRMRPDGVELHWRLTRRDEPVGDGLVPFLIDWDASPHPSATAAKGCRLMALWGEHPDPDRIRAIFVALGVELEVRKAAHPRLIARIETPTGTRDLR